MLLLLRRAFVVFRKSQKSLVEIPHLTRRQREAQNNFAGLRARLDRENQLHALMLSQRHYRGKGHV